MVLGYYLKYGAEIDVDADYMWLGEDFSLDLDVAMAARREGIPGAPTPHGILTAFENTPLGRITGDLEASPMGSAVNSRRHATGATRGHGAGTEQAN